MIAVQWTWRRSYILNVYLSIYPSTLFMLRLFWNLSQAWVAEWWKCLNQCPLFKSHANSSDICTSLTKPWFDYKMTTASIVYYINRRKNKNIIRHSPRISRCLFLSNSNSVLLVKTANNMHHLTKLDMKTEIKGNCFKSYFNLISIVQPKVVLILIL